jgi:N-acetylmuramoyl-L-alanine amidase
MQPYIICQGDYLAKLAYQFGFDADTIWNADQNAQLRQLRPNPNILFPADVLYIPDQTGAPPTLNVTTGTSNTFVANVPTLPVTFRFSDPCFASQAFSIQELDDLTGLTTDANGTVTFSAPVTLDTATLVFADGGATITCKIGALDPIETLAGVFQRLQHLGLVDTGATLDPTNLDFIRVALRALRIAQDGDATADSSPGSGQPPPSESSPPPSSSSGSGAGATPEDNAGLGDDGTLDDETSTLLLNAHGV